MRAGLAVEANRTRRSEVALRSAGDHGEWIEGGRRRRRGREDRRRRSLSGRVTQHDDGRAGDGDATLGGPVLDRPGLGDRGRLPTLIQLSRDANLRDVALGSDDRAETPGL